MAGSEVSMQVHCSAGYSGGKERGTCPSDCKHGTWSSWEPPRRPGSTAGLGHRQGLLLIPSQQEAVEEVDGTLAVLLRLLGH